MKKQKYDFSGWASKNGLKCSDGRTILKDAFQSNDGCIVPLVWNHQHGSVSHVLGHALLENRAEGVYTYCSFNNTKNGQEAKEAVTHGDIVSLSILANDLVQDEDRNVQHGIIREVSLVLAGANPGAHIEDVVRHGEICEGEAVICTGEEIDIPENGELIEHSSDLKDNNKEKTIKDVIDSMTEEQKNVLYALVEEAVSNELEDSKKEKEEDDSMKHNIFEGTTENNENTLTHAAVETIISDARRQGSMRESFLAHAAEYGIDNIEFLFPEDHNTTQTPAFISRDVTWVDQFMSKVHHIPFSRIKSMFADITEDQARAKGYIKGKFKKEEVFSLLKRSTAPTTIFKKQKIDRDDVSDITGFDVIAWIKSEMRMMLNEEIARSALLSDGRLSSDDDKVDELCVRPVVNDADLFVIRWKVAGDTEEEFTKNFTKAAIKARKNYKGSGEPMMYTTEDILTECLLLEDGFGHRLYKTKAELATALRVKDIITVPPMEGFEDKDGREVYAIIVNPSDYTIGADKGGSVNMFDDFDIDYNQQKYLIETRISGALTVPYSAIVLRAGDETASEEPTLAEAKAALN